MDKRIPLVLIPRLTSIPKIVSYFWVGCVSSLANIIFFALILRVYHHVYDAALIAYGLASIVNYALCKMYIFTDQVKHPLSRELYLYSITVVAMACFDAYITTIIAHHAYYPVVAKSISCVICFLMNFMLRKYVVFRPLSDTD